MAPATSSHRKYRFPCFEIRPRRSFHYLKKGVSRQVALLPPPLWLKFENFLADMGEKPEGGLSLDRIFGAPEVYGVSEPTIWRALTNPFEASASV
jgi:hypothetical protein